MLLAADLNGYNGRDARMGSESSSSNGPLDHQGKLVIRVPFLYLFLSAHGIICQKWSQMWPEVCVPTSPDLANILGDTDLDLENFDFLDFWIPDFWISRLLDFQIQGCHLVIFVWGGRKQ